MEPKSLLRIMQLNPHRRLDVIAEGLDLLVEHVATLRGDLAMLVKADRPRGAAVLNAHSEEEAAKVLILLDLVRMGWRDQSAATRQIKRLYDHLTRCIYAEVAQMCPADFHEIREIVDRCRQSHYLDGPNDVDWVFRNFLLAQREDSLYVDYIASSDGDEDSWWSTPARHEASPFPEQGTVQDLIGSLHRLGFTSRAGLDVLAAIWNGQTMDDSTHWRTLDRLIKRTIHDLYEAGLTRPDATAEDLRAVGDHWTFPLYALDFSMVRVSPEHLRQERAEWLATEE